MTEFTPLYGCYGADPLAYLLKMNDTTILLDCGWTTDFDVSLLEPLRAVAPTVDVVLVSHPDMTHCGALPYAVAHLGLSSARIFMTKACEDASKIMLRDAYRARRAQCTHDSEAGDAMRAIVRRGDVDECFLRVTGIEFGAPELINAKSGGAGASLAAAAAGYEKLVAKAIYAGRLLGGTVWVVKGDVEEVVYAVDFASTSKFEKVVPGIDWDQLAQPTHRVLITSAYHTPFAPHEVSVRVPRVSVCASWWPQNRLPTSPTPHTHAHPRTHTHARTHAHSFTTRTHTRTHAHTHFNSLSSTKRTRTLPAVPPRAGTRLYPQGALLSPAGRAASYSARRRQRAAACGRGRTRAGADGVAGGVVGG
jgi:hypothetical protein